MVSWEVVSSSHHQGAGAQTQPNSKERGVNASLYQVFRIVYGIFVYIEEGRGEKWHRVCSARKVIHASVVRLQLRGDPVPIAPRVSRQSYSSWRSSPSALSSERLVGEVCNGAAWPPISVLLHSKRQAARREDTQSLGFTGASPPMVLWASCAFVAP